VRHVRRRPIHQRRGFSLIELLIVIAILLAIGGLVVVNLLPKKAEADADLTRTQIQQFENALKYFQLDMKRYPNSDEGLAVLWNREAVEEDEESTSWKGPYLETPVPQDNWGTAWAYVEPSEIRDGASYDIVSAGPDREEGTDDDITNHDRYRDEDGEIDDTFDDFTPPDMEATN
jgi:general secretion pathway protein G